MANHRLEADYDFIDRTGTIIHRQYVDPCEFEALVETSQILHVAG
jgi:hypothetical protein